MFILDCFWPFLKVCWIFGLFPCEKKSDPETGVIKLVPTNGFIYAFRLLIFEGVTLAMTQFASSETLKLYDPGFDYLSGMLHFIQDINKSKIDYIIYILFLLSFQAMQIFCMLNNWLIRYGLEDLQGQFINHRKYISNQGKGRFYIRINFLLFFWALFAASIMTSIGITMFYLETYPALSNWTVGK